MFAAVAELKLTGRALAHHKLLADATQVKVWTHARMCIP